MPQTIEGTLSARGLRFAIVASRFNGLIVEPLIAGALDAIVRSGGDADAVTIVRCPGAWELPQVVRRVIARGNVDAVVALGAVIRGATPHFDYVAGEAAKVFPDRLRAKRPRISAASLRLIAWVMRAADVPASISFPAQVRGETVSHRQR